MFLLEARAISELIWFVLGKVVLANDSVRCLIRHPTPGSSNYSIKTLSG